MVPAPGTTSPRPEWRDSEQPSSLPRHSGMVVADPTPETEAVDDSTYSKNYVLAHLGEVFHHVGNGLFKRGPRLSNPRRGALVSTEAGSKLLRKPLSQPAPSGRKVKHVQAQSGTASAPSSVSEQDSEMAGMEETAGTETRTRIGQDGLPSPAPGEDSRMVDGGDTKLLKMPMSDDEAAWILVAMSSGVR